MTRLGKVFIGVMTSNMVFIGVAVVRRDPTLGAHRVVALAGYILGVARGSAGISRRLVSKRDRRLPRVGGS